MPGVRSAGDSGPRHRRRVHPSSSRIAAAGTPEYLSVPDAEVHRGGTEAARDRPHQLALPCLRAADVRRHRPGAKCPSRACSCNDVNTTLGALLGSSYINDFNRFGRVYKVYFRPSRSSARSGQLGLFFVRNTGRRDGSARHAGEHAARRRTGVHQPLQPVPRRRDHGRAGGRATRRRRRSTRSKRRRAKCCRPT